MPKFTQEELEEIRLNTQRVEKERKSKTGSHHDHVDGKSAKKTRAKKSGRKSDREHTLTERLIGPILLIITLMVSYLVMWWY